MRGSPIRGLSPVSISSPTKLFLSNFCLPPDFGNTAGDSTSGEADGGQGDGKGPGGNAYTGFAGPANGGDTVNQGGSVENTGITSEYSSPKAP
jgi:hypothetical protein